MYEQEAPFNVSIEPTEGCPLRCPFCGIHGIRGSKREYKFMSLDTAEKIASGLSDAGWNLRVDFALNGEPTMNPDFVDIVRIFKRYLPKGHFLVITNGAKLLKDSVRRVTELWEAGVDCIAVDDYSHVTWAAKIKSNVAGSLKILHYPEDGNKANPHRKIKGKRLVFIEDVTNASKGNHSRLMNYGGVAFPPDYSYNGKICAHPFRKMVFRWDGSVDICCRDWRGYYIIGNVHDLSVEELWQHPRFVAARKKLYHGQRDFKPCYGCDSLSYRVGLLPDKKGLEYLPRPDKDDENTIKETLAAGPLTEPVLREWERN